MTGKLPREFVWTRYGTEGGEAAASILARKERERSACGGLFLWGIGNSVAPALRCLLASTTPAAPAVVLSPMLSKPRAEDTKPSGVVRWRRAQALDGREWAMPPGSLVTSRMTAGGRLKTRHFALVCWSAESLHADLSAPRFSIGDLQNYASGHQVGHSQVTSVVRRIGHTPEGEYVAALVAVLTYPFVVELSAPAPVVDAFEQSGSYNAAEGEARSSRRVQTRSERQVRAEP